MEQQKRPTNQEIGEYELGLLPPERAREVARYLERHPHGAHQHSILQSFLAQWQPQERSLPSLKERVTILVAQLLSASNWQAAGVRGEQTGIYQVGEVQVTVQVDSDLDKPAAYALIGVITGGTWADARVALWRSESPQTVVETECDEDGHFMLDGVTAGAYELIIQGEQTAVHIPDLLIGN